MATIYAIFIPTELPIKIPALAATSSSAVQTFSNYRLVAIEATGDINVAFGNSGMPAATATGWLIPAGSVHTFDLGSSLSALSIFNPGAAAVDVYIMPLNRN